MLTNSIFNTDLLRFRYLSSGGASLLSSVSQNSVPCDFNHYVTNVFTSSSLANLWPERQFLTAERM